MTPAPFCRGPQRRESLLYLALVATAFLPALALYGLFWLVYSELESLVDPAWLPASASAHLWAAALSFLIVSLVLFVHLALGRRRAPDGPSVAQRLGAIPVDPHAENPVIRRLLRKVDELSVAAGIPAPMLFVLPGEASLNAFAAGHSPEDAVVALTEGLAVQASDAELEGVLAHEIAHIVHGDIRLNLRLLAFAASLTSFWALGRTMLERPARFVATGRFLVDLPRKAFSLLLALLGGVVLASGSLGYLVSVLLKRALLRQREFHADDAAVGLTGHADGLHQLLSRIRDSSRSTLHAPGASQVSHMFFVSDLGGWTDRLLATHPRLGQRLERLEMARDAGAAPPSRPSASGSDAPLVRARDLLARCPTPLLDLAHAPWDASRLSERIIRLAANPSSAIDHGAGSPSSSDPPSMLSDLPSELWLPLLELSLPALRRLEPGRRYHWLRGLGESLTSAEEEPSLHAAILFFYLECPLTDRGLLRPSERSSDQAVVDRLLGLMGTLEGTGAPAGLLGSSGYGPEPSGDEVSGERALPPPSFQEILPLLARIDTLAGDLRVCLVESLDALYRTSLDPVTAGRDLLHVTALRAGLPCPLLTPSPGAE